MDKGHSESSRRDPAQLETLFQQGRAGLTGLHVRVVLERSGQRLAALSASTDPAAMARICHDLKTSCRIVGARHLAQLCEALEYATENGSPPPAGAVQELNEGVSASAGLARGKAAKPRGHGAGRRRFGSPRGHQQATRHRPRRRQPGQPLLMSVILGQTYGITEYTSARRHSKASRTLCPTWSFWMFRSPGWMAWTCSRLFVRTKPW